MAHQFVTFILNSFLLDQTKIVFIHKIFIEVFDFVIVFFVINDVINKQKEKNPFTSLAKSARNLDEISKRKSQSQCHHESHK